MARQRRRLVTIGLVMLVAGLALVAVSLATSGPSPGDEQPPSFSPEGRDAIDVAIALIGLATSIIGLCTSIVGLRVATQDRRTAAPLRATPDPGLGGPPAPEVQEPASPDPPPPPSSPPPSGQPT